MDVYLLSSSSRAAPGVRRLTRGCTVAAPAAAPTIPGRTAAPRGPARAVWQFGDTSARRGNLKATNEKELADSRYWVCWRRGATKNPSCRRVLFFGASPARCWFFLANLLFGAATSCAPLHTSWPDGRAEGNVLTNHRSKFEVRRPSHVIKSGRGNRRSLFCVKHS